MEGTTGRDNGARRATAGRSEEDVRAAVAERGGDGGRDGGRDGGEMVPERFLAAAGRVAPSAVRAMATVLVAASPVLARDAEAQRARSAPRPPTPGVVAPQPWRGPGTVPQAQAAPPARGGRGAAAAGRPGVEEVVTELPERVMRRTVERGARVVEGTVAVRTQRAIQKATSRAMDRVFGRP